MDLESIIQFNIVKQNLTIPILTPNRKLDDHFKNKFNRLKNHEKKYDIKIWCNLKK